MKNKSKTIWGKIVFWVSEWKTILENNLGILGFWEKADFKQFGEKRGGYRTVRF